MRMSCNSNDREAVRMAVAFGSYPLIGLLQQQQQQEGEDGLGSRSQRREPREKNIKFLTPAGDSVRIHPASLNSRPAGGEEGGSSERPDQQQQQLPLLAYEEIIRGDTQLLARKTTKINLVPLLLACNQLRTPTQASDKPQAVVDGWIKVRTCADCVHF